MGRASGIISKVSGSKEDSRRSRKMDSYRWTRAKDET